MRHRPLTKVERTFPPGTRVRMRATGTEGEVITYLPDNGVTGVLVVRWDRLGYGQHSHVLLEVVKGEQ
jgi:hypothetical protein